MSNLAEELRVADQICSSACPLLEEAASLKADAEVKVTKARKNKTIFRVVAIVALITIVPSMVSTPLTLALGNAGGIIGMPLSLVLGVLIYKKIISPMIESYGRKAEKNYEESINRANESEAEGSRILSDNTYALSVIPEEYWYPMATNYLYKVIRAGRAESVSQALQMYDDQLHRWKIEEANAEMVSQQKAQTVALKGIRKSNAINAAANVANAAANISRWF